MSHVGLRSRGKSHQLHQSRLALWSWTMPGVAWAAFCLLTLFAMRADAQTDSSVLTFHFRGQRHDYGFSTVINTMGVVTTGYQAGRVASLLDIYAYAWKKDSTYLLTQDTTNPISFEVDAAAGLLRHVELFINSSASSANTFYRVKMDSIPFKRVKGDFVVTKQMHAGDYTWTVIYDNENPRLDPPGYDPETGSQSDAGEEVDTLDMQMAPILHAAVQQMGDASVQMLSVIYDGNRATIQCPPADFERTVEILDLQGRTVAGLQLSANESVATLSTSGKPVGLYFARLGSQVAKFMVECR